MMFSSKNYVLAYRSKADAIEPLLWDVDLRPMFPEHFSQISQNFAKSNLDSSQVSYTMPRVNIDASAILLNSVFDTWDDIPDLITLDAISTLVHVDLKPSADRELGYASTSTLAQLVCDIRLAHAVIQTDYLYGVDWQQISDIYNIALNEAIRWTHLLIYANRFNPSSIKLAPIMHREIIDTICNYYHFANWVLMVIKIDPVKFKSENFVLLRIN
jgi:hypothetical protein